MPQPTVRILGAYRVELTADLFSRAMETKYGGLKLSSKDRKEAEEFVRQELSSIALLDVLVSNPDERFNVGDFTQPDSDQAPYDEAYLSLDGASVVSYFKPPAGDSFRVAFFLHFFDPGKPLTTSYGETPIPKLQKMPKHYQEMMPYKPID